MSSIFCEIKKRFSFAVERLSELFPEEQLKKMREKMLQLGMIDKFKFAFRNAVVAYVGFAVLAILNIVIYAGVAGVTIFSSVVATTLS